jgi:UDP-glucose 6-dehydrogenase
MLLFNGIVNAQQQVSFVEQNVSKSVKLNFNAGFHFSNMIGKNVQKDDNIFLFTRTNKHEEPDMIFEPDEDFYQSISMEEVREKLHKVIDKLYA